MGKLLWSRPAAFFAGALATLVLAQGISWPGGSPERDGSLRAGFGSGLASLLVSPAFAAQIHSDLGDGDYTFLPNRRTIWVVNRKYGRFANYHFRDDQERSILRSQVVTLDQRDFPPEDAVYLLSDRNLTEVLWVCNRRTGDVQLWHPRPDGKVVSEGQIATSVDLMERSP